MAYLELESDRLCLIPITLKECEVLLKQSYTRTSINVHDESNWPTQETLDVLSLNYKTLKLIKTPTGFECWKIVLKENMIVIGDIGFHSQPDAKGCVEIGYGLIPTHHKMGYGFEALSLLLEWAFKQPTVKTIKAVCLIDNKASIKLLQKVGMKEVYRDAIKIEWECHYFNRYD